MTDHIEQVQIDSLSENERERRREMEDLGNVLKINAKASSQLLQNKTQNVTWKSKVTYNNFFDVDYYDILNHLDPLIRYMLKTNQSSEEFDDKLLLDSFSLNNDLQVEMINQILKKRVSRSTKTFLKDIKSQIEYTLTHKQLRSLLVSYNNTLTRKEMK